MGVNQQVVSLAKSADLEQLEILYLSDQEIINSTDERGVSALMWAQYYGHPLIVSWFVEKRKSLSLFEASAVGDLEFLRKEILREGSTINAYSIDGFTALGLASYFGHTDYCNELLVIGADPNCASKNQLKVTPLHSALARGSIEIAKLLVDHGADVNAVAGGNWSVLHYCTDLGDVLLTQWMLERGARLGPKNDEGFDAADHGYHVGHDEAAEAIKNFLSSTN